MELVTIKELEWKEVDSNYAFGLYYIAHTPFGDYKVRFNDAGYYEYVNLPWRADAISLPHPFLSLDMAKTFAKNDFLQRAGRTWVNIDSYKGEGLIWVTHNENTKESKEMFSGELCFVAETPVGGFVIKKNVSIGGTIEYTVEQAPWDKDFEDQPEHPFCIDFSTAMWWCIDELKRRLELVINK